MKKVLFILLCSLCTGCNPAVRISKDAISDKIKGAWAGQTIGCAYGGPTEFKYTDPIPDSIRIKWDGSEIAWYFDNMPGMYDDIYMDLTFLNTLDNAGLDASAEVFADSFANAGYPLWHANQAARYNILNGMAPPASGHWMNNPHADDIDFQIEADFAGIINPGMPQSAAALCDTVGHIMNYGDGWYGGVFISTMYSLSFLSSDIDHIVRAACNVIPEGTKFHNVIADIIDFHDKNPDDWKSCRQMVEDRYGTDMSCPSFLCKPGNIDATVNSAYVAIGLLYGNLDFGRSIEIATRCGNDSDCNPSSVGGVLGTVLGYGAIPEEWLDPLKENEYREFPYTGMTLNDAYDLSFDLAMKNIEKFHGRVYDRDVLIRMQNAVPVRSEQSFKGLSLQERKEISQSLRDSLTFPFEGRGLVVKYNFTDMGNVSSDYVAEVRVSIDGMDIGIMKMPLDENSRKLEIFHKYDLKDGNHVIRLGWKNPINGLDIIASSIITYK